MAWLLPVSLSCISFLYLQLPGTLPLQGGSQRPARPREPLVWTPSSSRQQFQYPSRWPVIWKPRHALQPQKSANLPPAVGQPLRNGPLRHMGPPRPRAQLLRVGCVLGTCRVQNLSHRLWQLVASAGPRDSAPIDPSSPHSYG